MSVPSLSILALVYDEEDNVVWAVPQLVALADEVTSDFEIVLITHPFARDRTNEIVADLSRRDPRIRGVNQPDEVRGYGPAFAFGLTQVRKEFVFHTDIDGQFDFGDLRRAVRALNAEGADMVHFNRKHRKDPIERKIIGLGFKLLVHLFYDCPFWDFDSAFNLFRASLLRDLRILSNSGMAVPEFHIRLKQRGAKIVVGWTEHRPRRAGSPTWELKTKGLILPDFRIVWANLVDIWRLRRALHSRFAW
jgi:glycosyl transferase family 2